MYKKAPSSIEEVVLKIAIGNVVIYL